MANISTLTQIANGLVRQVNLPSSTLLLGGLYIGGVSITSSASGNAGSKLIGDDNSYSNFTPATPTVKAALQAIDSALSSVSAVVEYNNGNSGSSLTINFANGPVQGVTMTANCAFTFTNHGSVGSIYVLRLLQGGAGNYTVTWPATVKWPGNIPPTLSGPSFTDLINFYFDGTYYLGSYSLNY